MAVAPMRCQVLLFAGLAEAIGQDQLTIELPEGASVRDALAQLAAAHHDVREMQGTLAVAVNERYASAETSLADGDTLALIPPVSGG